MPTWHQDKTHIDTEIFRHFLTIQQNQAGTKGSHGELLANWVTVYQDVPAAIQPLTGRELELQRQLVVNATTKITLRYLPEVQAVTWRFKWLDHCYSIGFVQNPDYRRRLIVATCYEEVSSSS